MKGIIISGGSPPTKELLEKEISTSSIIIGADSGANILYEYGLKPDILLGDFDSIDKKVLEYYKNLDCNIDIYPSEKDFTDTELAFNKATELSCDEICFLGCTGSRMDHFLGNLGLLKRCLKKGINAYIKDDNNYIFLTDKSLVLKGNRGQTFSLQAYSDVVKNLSIHNAKYKLENYDLTLGDPMTVSNEFLDTDVEVVFDEGFLMILFTCD